MSKKIVSKAVNTKAFETAIVKMETEKIYTVQSVNQRFVICVDGTPTNKHGEPADNVADVFTYRNEKLAFESLAIFKACK